MEHIKMLFQFIGGLGMFIYGMNIMANGLQKAAGAKTQKLMGALTNNRALAVLVGALITCIIQSSSATTVMVVGFVNAGIMDLTQAVGVIMGANIGTTITSWLVSLNELGPYLKPEFYAPLLVGIGAFLLMFAKRENLQEGGSIFVGFGILFIGLSFMSGSISPYKNSPIFSQAFQTLGSNPILGILVGLVVTAIIQSSSASVGILQTLATNGMVTWNSAIFITLGQNMGTCVTALLSSLGASRNGKRASMIHLLFNTIGALLFGVIMFVLFRILPDFANSSISSLGISVFHTIFNVSCTILLFPFANWLVTLSGLLVKESDEEKELGIIENAKRHLDTRILENPAFAIETVSHEVTAMGKLAFKNTQLATDALLNDNKNAAQQVLKNELTINAYTHMLTDYLVQLDSQSPITQEQHTQIKNMLYTVSDIERISDHCENIAELAESKWNYKTAFSSEGIHDLQLITENVLLALEHGLTAREKPASDAISTTWFYENKVDGLEEALREKHIGRLSKGICSTQSGILFLDAISNLERISDHAKNIADYTRV
jgi:phosphate:Na+ symporter